MSRIREPIKTALRPARESDLALIYNSWAYQIRHSEPFCLMNPEQFREHKVSIIEPLLERLGATVIYDDDEGAVNDEHVLGWCVIDAANCVIHFIYVKGDWRHCGYGQKLLDYAFPNWRHEALKFSHQSRSSLHLAKKWGALFDPYSVALNETNASVKAPFLPEHRSVFWYKLPGEREAAR